MRRGQIVRGFVLSGLLGGTVVAAPAQATQFAAHVLEVKGQWHLDGAAELLTPGYALVAGAKVIAALKRQGDAITIVRDGDLTRQRTVCDGSSADPCREPLVVQGMAAIAQASGLSQVEGVLQAAFAVLLGNPPAISSHYALTLTRGSPLEKELEGVAAVDGAGAVVLPKETAEMFPGDYTALLSPAGSSSTTAIQTSLSAQHVWMPLPVGAPGLYELTIKDAEGHKLANLMLLAVEPAKYDATEASLDALRKRTAAWSGPSARADEHLMVRAFLLSQSQTP